ncbi:xyloglucan O-acetyltransferase 1-like [Cornus florida]|uniref:xyloglucan O-acetyltransferase 1-like n=1 Tax=Cornus florida TaxID=4283 RepID=UPI00289872EA|nr:xyloglucan O-acetyltransferase 1-like [Cornus florida]
MGTTKALKLDQSHSLTKKFLLWTLYALLSIAIIHLYLSPITLPLSPTDHLPPINPIFTTAAAPTAASSPSQEGERRDNVVGVVPCDYTNGQWVNDKLGPLYNGTSCGTIKDGQNCMGHGRPDMGYLYWRWRPDQCHLPRFDPNTFLQIMANKHIAFVGDSMARNQLESLLCLLATVSAPNLVYTNGEDNKFRRWHFKSHNVNVSVYWSPFLVKGVEKNGNLGHNKLYLDSVDERWAFELDGMDMVVLSVGHWFLHPAVYFDGDKVLGCHSCDGENFTEIGFYDVFRRAFETTLNGIIDRRKASENALDVMVTTFSPHHFEGAWDKFGACPKTEPYKVGEKRFEGMDFDMRRIGVEEVEVARLNAKRFARLRVEALDVTELSLMRPDGHPGPYMYPFPFANGIGERVQNDCVHWCLPGPVDTWNEILLDVMKRWNNQSRSGNVINEMLS